MTENVSQDFQTKSIILLPNQDDALVGGYPVIKQLSLSNNKRASRRTAKTI